MQFKGGFNFFKFNDDRIVETLLINIRPQIQFTRFHMYSN